MARSNYEFCFTISGETLEEFDKKYQRVRNFLSVEWKEDVEALARQHEKWPADPVAETPDADEKVIAIPVTESPPAKRRPGRPPKTTATFIEELPAPATAALTAPAPASTSSAPLPPTAPGAVNTVSSSFTATKQEAVAALTALHGAKGELETRKILKALGVDRFSKLTEKDYGPLVAACNAAMKGLAAAGGSEGIFG